MIPDTNQAQLVLVIGWAIGATGYVIGTIRHLHRWRRYRSFMCWFRDQSQEAERIRAEMWARDEWRRSVLKGLLVISGINRLTIIVERSEYTARVLNLVDLDVSSLLVYLAILVWLTGWTVQADRDRRRETDAEVEANGRSMIGGPGT